MTLSKISDLVFLYHRQDNAYCLHVNTEPSNRNKGLMIVLFRLKV